MVLDRRSLSYAALGLGPSWLLLDGIFAEVALFDRTQPEGLALATYLTAVSAVANTIVVPGHAVVQRRVQWSLRTWVGGAVYAQLATALVLAAFWHARAGGASVALCLCVFATSLVGNFQQLALNPWAAETGRAVRIVELMAGGNAGALLRWWVPAGHTSHATFPKPGADEPALQGNGAIAPSVHADPGGHASHAALPLPL